VYSVHIIVMQQSLKELFDKGIIDKIYPGYSGAYITSTDCYTFFGGSCTYDADSKKVTEDTLYDVASLTKIVGPMAVMMHLVDIGKVDMDDKVLEYLPIFANDVLKSQATIKHLLTYTLEYVLEDGMKSKMSSMHPDELANQILELPLKFPPGATYMYSNITAFLLTQVIEKITKENFYTTVQEKILIPCEMTTATFFPLCEERVSIPPTEMTKDRGLVQGFVHDESTYYLQKGGICSGASGLFASALDMAKFMKYALSFAGKDTSLFSDAMTHNFITNQFSNMLPITTPLGWGDGNNELISSYPGRFVVKGGFTGCFVIGDLQMKQAVVILSNATYPKRPKDRTAFNEMKQKIVELLIK
jgi:CubicO group peptidase (beta-lactamase class C family)